MSETTYEEICAFCSEISGETTQNAFYDHALVRSRNDYILHETEHFIAVPAIGALTDWYVFVVPTRHVLSTGWLPDLERTELREVLCHVKQRMEKISGASVLAFEHGSLNFRNKSGACYDHAHVHLVATNQDTEGFVDHVPVSVTMRECDDWIETTRSLIQDQQRSYLALDDGVRQMVGESAKAPAQFFRRCLADWLGVPEGEWDFAASPQLDRVRAMLASGL